MPRELPISLARARKATNWLMTNFGGSIRTATAGSPFTPAILCSIVCQETAYFWLALVPTVSPDDIVARCVLDGSGDVPNTSRSAYPRNAAAFRADYGDDFTDLLIAEANATRALRGYGPKPWLYKGYGIFQYDLQFVKEDEGYFRFKQWHDFEVCLHRVMGELTAIYARNGGNLWESVRAYNGGGQAARNYRDNVKQYAPEAQKEIDSMAAAPRSLGTRAGKPAKSSKAPKTAKPAKPKADGVLLATAIERPRRIRAARKRGGELPASKPQTSRKDVLEKIACHGIDRAKHPLVVIGIRGYYRDTMGAPGVNDRGMYDDALFLDSPDIFAVYNGNTDPSRYRPGEGTSEATKGIAALTPGAWFVHQFDLHNGKYLALCQRAGKVTVIRDGKKENYSDTGNFGINIHRGSYHGTSSLGCQTLHPDQWESFIATATDQARRYHGDRWKRVVIPYVLVENA